MTRSNPLSLVVVAALYSITLAATAFPADPEPAPGAQSGLVAPAPPPRPEPAPNAEAPRPEGRELAGHVFTPLAGITGPFATTSFGSFMLVGAGSTEGSLTLQLPGTPLPPPQTFTGTVTYAAVGGILGFEYAFLPGFSARLNLSETIYSGIDGQSAAVVGSNARLGGDFGITAGIPIGKSARVAAVADVSYTPRLGMLIGSAIEQTFSNCSQGTANCKFDLGLLFQQTNVFQFQPGVAASWAPNKALGVTGNVSYVYNSISTSNAATLTQGGVAVGVGLDFDFMGFSKVPVGLQLSWSSFFNFSTGDNTTGYTDLGFGLLYTGKKDLSLGIQVVDRRFRVAPDVDVSWKNVISFIGLRYYW
jgi:hypothetical protein